MSTRGLFAAKTTFEIDGGKGREKVGSGRKLNLPEVEIWIAESDAIDLAARVIAQLANEADFCFAAGIEKSKREDFVGGEFVASNYSGAMAAENEGMRFFREDTAGGVGSEEEDRKLFRNATASAHT